MSTVIKRVENDAGASLIVNFESDIATDGVTAVDLFIEYSTGVETRAGTSRLPITGTIGAYASNVTPVTFDLSAHLDIKGTHEIQLYVQGAGINNFTLPNRSDDAIWLEVLPAIRGL